MADDQSLGLGSTSSAVASWLALASSENWQERRSAIRSLIGSTSMLRRSRAVARRLAELLDDESRKVRVPAALALWQIKSSTAIAPLARLSANPDELGKVAIVALASQQSEAAADALLANREAWSSKPSDLAQWIRAIGWSGQADFGDLLRGYLIGQPWSVRWTAALALADLGDEQGVRAAEELCTDPDAPPTDAEEHLATARRLRRRWERVSSALAENALLRRRTLDEIESPLE